MVRSVLSTHTLRQQFVAEVNAAASQAASAYDNQEAAAGPRSAFWIALGRVAQEQPAGWERRTRSLADLGRRAWRVLFNLVRRNDHGHDAGRADLPSGGPV